MLLIHSSISFFFFNDTATTEIYTLSLHDALPICCTADLGVHMLDTCLHLLGEFDFKSVSAQTFARFGPRGLGETDWGKSSVDPKKPFEVEDYSVALLKLKSGRAVSLEVSWAGHHA